MYVTLNLTVTGDDGGLYVCEATDQTGKEIDAKNISLDVMTAGR